MIAAVLGAVRGQAGALRAALGSIADAGIETIVCTGNLAAGGDSGAEALALLRAHGVICVQGEEDRLLARAHRKAGALRDRLGPERLAALLRAHDALPAEDREFLRRLPRLQRLSVDGVPIVVCHGSLTSQRERLGPDTPLVKLARQRELAPAALIASHAEKAYAREVAGALFLSAGPVAQAPGVAAWTLADLDTLPGSAQPQTAAWKGGAEGE